MRRGTRVMKHLRMSTICATLMGSILVAGCSGQPKAVDPVASYEHVISSPSWAVWFTTLPDLAARTDLAVAGTVTKVVSVENIGSDPTSGILQTTYDFTVNRTLIGSKSGVIQISQTGGIDNQHKIVLDVEDDPRFTVGESAVLFLTEVKPGLYAVQGGPTGRFRLNDGMITPVTTAGIPMKNVSLDALASQVRG